ncbi:uncharacterized protein LOC133824424 [Humulus lupulus]|uniref:uncharacterized protein LOC133824424 n=1 Tax=Humulus lupulus TaxID=3486 RepID=UPI002B407CAC|nr:uncharacterized protein LOC133824424 [Humulus lupulus]
MFKGWCFSSNLMHHPNGRIVVAWNPLSFDVDIRGGSNQWMHFHIQGKNGTQFALTVVYALNNMKVLSPSDRFPYRGNGLELVPFQSCVENCRLVDVKFSGSFYTWNNKQAGKDRVFAKLDRVLANDSWLEKFNSAEVVFFPEGDMDHCPFMVNFGTTPETRKPFKFFNFWSNLEGFQRIVTESWAKEVKGTPMFCLISKLKRLRVDLKDLNRNGKGDVFVREVKMLKLLLDIQGKLQANLGNIHLIDEEITRRKDY